MPKGHFDSTPLTGIRSSSWAPPNEPVEFIYYTRWYYDHGSTFMPVHTLLDGTRAYPDQLLDQGFSVFIRPATAEEHDRMADRFDVLTDKFAAGDGGTSCWVSGIGNFEKDEAPPNLDAAIAGIKARARIEPRKVRS